MLSVVLLGIASANAVTSAVALAQQAEAVWIRPVCQDHRSWWDDTNEGMEAIDGVLTDEFFEAFKQALSYLGIKPHPTEPRRFSVRWDRLPEPRQVVQSTILAIEAVIRQRHDPRTVRDIGIRRGRLPTPDFHPLDGFPTCTAVRKIALKGWEWAERGPPLTHVK